MLPNRERAHDEGKSHFDAAPPPSPLPVYLYFTNRFQKERNTLGLSGTAQSARRERGGGRKKTKKIIIKMSHRESPMRVARARKKKKKKKFGNIIKIRWKPLPLPPSPFSPSTRPVFSIPLSSSSSREYIPLGYLGRTEPCTNIHSIVFNARREDLSSRSFGFPMVK